MVQCVSVCTIMNFNGKVVLITGASSGIGAEAAIAFARLGATLAISGRNAAKLHKTAELCKNEPPLEIIGDVNRDDVAKLVITATIRKYGRLDVLVNCAGIIESGSIEDTSLEQYDRIMQTNVRSLYHLTMLAVPELVKTRGNIVNISSVCGLRSAPNALAYHISKSAVDQFTRCVALELAAKGVRCNAVNPGVIVTELHKRGGMNDEQYQQFLDRCKTSHAMGRPGQVEEVANAICFLASDLASFTTGTNLPVDGGRHIMCPR